MGGVVFTDAALDDLRRIGPAAVPRVLKKVILLEQDPRAGAPLGGELTGFRKLVVGRNTWRIVYRILEDNVSVEICEVWAVGARRDAEVYADATDRVRKAAETRPELIPLAQVVQRLGGLAQVAEVPTAPPRDPVPDWLADRLVHTAHLPREQVAAMDLRQALDAWTAHITGQR